VVAVVDVVVRVALAVRLAQIAGLEARVVAVLERFRRGVVRRAVVRVDGLEAARRTARRVLVLVLAVAAPTSATRKKKHGRKKHRRIT
jgi:hypothetical protein